MKECERVVDNRFNSAQIVPITGHYYFSPFSCSPDSNFHGARLLLLEREHAPLMTVVGVEAIFLTR